MVLPSPGHRRWRPDQVEGTGRFQAVKTEVALGPGALASPQGAHGWERKTDRHRTRERPGTGALREPDGGNLTVSPGQSTRVEGAARASQETCGGPREFGKAEQDRETQAGPEAGVGAGREAGRVWRFGTPCGDQPLLLLPHMSWSHPTGRLIFLPRVLAFAFRSKTPPRLCGKELAARGSRVWWVIFPVAGERKVPRPSRALRRSVVTD